MLNEVYTIDWPALSTEMLKKSLNEKLEALFLRSKNSRFVKNSEMENTLKECCAEDNAGEEDEVF